VTNLRKFIIVLAVIVGILVVYSVITIFQNDYSNYPKIFYEYKSKGKTTQFNIDDVKKGFK
jgi:hypothetical protein